MRTAVALALVVALGGTAALALEAKQPKPNRPRLEVRAIPMMGMAPVEVLVMIDLKGGDELEDFYCPEIEVLWDDGGKSSQESDCPPFEPGTQITRHFSVGHEYQRGGEFEVRVRLKRADRVVSSAHVRVSIRPPLGSGF
jgi:hypothetical protein